MATAVPAEIAEAIANAYRRLGDNVAVAVRSEDAGDSSFAGMNATFTNVIGLHNVLARVKDCWASLYGERVLTFNVLQSCRPRLDPCAVDAAQVAVAEALTAEAYDTAAVQNRGRRCSGPARTTLPHVERQRRDRNGGRRRGSGVLQETGARRQQIEQQPHAGCDAATASAAPESGELDVVTLSVATGNVTR